MKEIKRRGDIEAKKHNFELMHKEIEAINKQIKILQLSKKNVLQVFGISYETYTRRRKEFNS